MLVVEPQAKDVVADQDACQHEDVLTVVAAYLMLEACMAPFWTPLLDSRAAVETHKPVFGDVCRS